MILILTLFIFQAGTTLLQILYQEYILKKLVHSGVMAMLRADYIWEKVPATFFNLDKHL